MMLFTAPLLSGCSPVYTIARDLIEAQSAQRQAASFPTPPRAQDPQPYLNARFRPELQRVLPHTHIGFARCPSPPDAGGIEMVRCTITVGSTRIPILAQYNPADRHLNSTLAMSPLRRLTLERNAAQRIEAEYGITAQVSCPGPLVRFSIPDTYIPCNVRANGGIERTIKLFVIDSGGWLSLEARPLPQDERELSAAYAAHNGSHIPGSIIEHIILRRSAAFGSEPPVKLVKCPRFLKLDNERHVYCDIKAGDQWIAERIAYIHKRLAFRMGGTYVSLRRIEDALSTYVHSRSGRAAHVSIDCAESDFVFLPPSGYHWCEISGPANYPKRLVITAMDKEGHYDMFFSNFSQSALRH
jgi:hypothetical protein